MRSEMEQRAQLLHGGEEVGGRHELRCEDPHHRRDHPLLGSESLARRMDHRPLLGTSKVQRGGVEVLCKKEQSSRTGVSRR